MSRQGSLSEEAIVDIINQSKTYPPKLIGLSIHDDSSLANLTLSTLMSAPAVVFGCEAGESKSRPIGTGPPLNLLTEDIGFLGEIGFTDLQKDTGNIIRRQILGMDKNEVCPTDTSFAFQIAKIYLREQGYEYEYKNDTAYLGNFAFRKMGHNSGSYRSDPNDFAGYQIPINYRSNNPRTINLTDILNGSALKQEPKLLLDKIVMVGLAADSEDVYQTPYALGQQTPGVLIHAQMTSQIVSALLDDRPLIYVPSSVIANCWLYIWTVFGTLLLFFMRSIKIASIILFIQILTFNIIYMLLFSMGIWLPYTTVILSYFLIGLLISSLPEAIKLLRS